MYHEIEGLHNIKTIIFDDAELIAGDQHYPYSEIESLEITSAPLFAAFGILTLRTKGRDIAIPFVRSRKQKLESALRELDRLFKSGGGGQTGPSEKSGSAAAAADSDPYEELKKLKELLDLDIITQKEFESKKKKLLDL